MSASYPEVVVDHEGDLPSSEETIFLGFQFLETDLLFEVRILDDRVQSRSNLRRVLQKMWKIPAHN